MLSDRLTTFRLVDQSQQNEQQLIYCFNDRIGIAVYCGIQHIAAKVSQ